MALMALALFDVRTRGWPFLDLRVAPFDQLRLNVAGETRYD
jgi:hypothetical protein